MNSGAPAKMEMFGEVGLMVPGGILQKAFQYTMLHVHVYCEDPGPLMWTT